MEDKNEQIQKFQSLDFKPTTILDIRQRTSGLVCVSRHFCDLLLGQDVTLVTNHKHLTFALEKLSPTMSPRQINYISQFCKTIKYIPGIHNQVADSLSRFEINYIQDPDFQIDFAQ